MISEPKKNVFFRLNLARGGALLPASEASQDTPECSTFGATLATLPALLAYTSAGAS